jgi:hypothetical protein
MNKKLQVFVSSTYKDLIEERQAAVEAILDAGHIPAGMELFKAGNETQLKTIYRWIDESDVYMLILGGRYGSIESKSGKSYTQLEYEYALSKDIPVFAVVLTQTFLTMKINLLGLQNVVDSSDNYQTFKTLVMSKIVREVDDCKDIKITIHSTLNDFTYEYALAGWSRNTPENDTAQLLRDNNTLMKENLTLSKQVQKLKEQLESRKKEQFGNFSFDELVEILKSKIFNLPLRLVAHHEEAEINALLFFITYYNSLVTGISNYSTNSVETKYVFKQILPYYVSFDLVEKVKLTGTNVQRMQASKNGTSFYAILEAKGMIETNKNILFTL